MRLLDRRASVALGAAAVVLAGSVVPLGSAGGGTAVLGVGFDKWVHAAEFALLAAAVDRALVTAPGRSRRRALATAATLALGFGLGIELLQAPIPWRTASVADFAADGVGVAVGAVAARIGPHVAPR